MSCSIIYSFKDFELIFEPHIMMDTHTQIIVGTVPRLSYRVLKTKRRMADRMIAQHFDIPYDQLTRHLPHYEDYLLHYLRQTIYRFQLGWVTETQYQQLLTDLLTSYKGFFMKGSPIYACEQGLINSTKRHFSQKADEHKNQLP